MFVFILLYNANSKDEGVHSLSYGNRDVVLMFESGVSANYYASILEAYGFPKPAAELIDDKEIKKFCLSAGYEFEFIPAGQVAIPPKIHKGDLGSLLPLKQSTASFDSKQKTYYLTSLTDSYFMYKRSIIDLQRERAIRGFSVEINRQIEYYTEEIEKIEVEVQKMGINSIH